MIKVKKEGILLLKTALGFECEGVLNPAVIKDGDTIHLLYRAVAKGNYSSIGYCTLNGPLMVENRMDSPLLYPQFEYESQGMEDPRIVKIDDLFYLTYSAYDGVNALGALAISKDLIHFEKLGIIVPQITYKEFSRLAESKHCLNEKYLRYNLHEGIKEKKGKQIYVWDKNVLFFPKRIDGKLFFLHRVRPLNCNLLITPFPLVAEKKQ